MIKLIAIDLDGTLYNSQHEINPRGRDAVHKALENGLHPVIVTGRGRRGAERALATLGLDIPYICSAGALVRPGTEGEAFFSWSYHVHDEIMHIIRFVRQNRETGLIAEIPTGRPYWFGPDSMTNIMDDLTTKEMFKSIRTNTPESDLNQPLLKMTLVAEYELLQQAEEIIRANCPSLHQTYAGRMYLDVTAQNTNKGRALMALADRWGITLDEVAAIGDQQIDLHMLKVVGLPVAVENAVPEVKQAAAWIAPSNDEDGVAWTVDKILEENQR